MSQSKIVILGAGMAGLGAAHRLATAGQKSVIYEKNAYSGGHAATFVHGDFIFDDGPHISFTQDQRLQELFAKSVGGEYEVLQTRVNNFWRGHWIKHPAQCNLHGLPEDLVVQIIRDFVAVHGREKGEVANYADWLVATYGKTFAETFPMQYGRKYHTVEAENMTLDWLGPRLYQPNLEEVLRGALSPQTPDVHYVSHFRYPTHGGFAAFLADIVGPARVKLGQEVVAIDPRSRCMRFADGREEPFDQLISSLPLPELIRRLDDVPAAVRQAAAQLACTSCVVVNVGVDREALSDCHWTYFYDQDYCFTRLSFPHMLSPNTVPKGAGSIQCEVYYSPKYRPLDRQPEACIEPVMRDLRRCGLLRDEDTILHTDARLVTYANIIFDLQRPAALQTILDYLAELGIATCGRYGRWGYHWTDESFLSGEDAGQEIIDRL
jgi:protoporphyrinogen oxidase